MFVNISFDQFLLLSLLLCLRGSSAQLDCSTSVPNNSVVLFNSRNLNIFNTISQRTEPFPIPGWTLYNEDQIEYDASTRNVTLEWEVSIPVEGCSPEYTVCTSASQITPNSSLEQNWIITNYFITEATNIRIRIQCDTNNFVFSIDCRNAIRAYYLNSDQNLTNVTSQIDQFQPTEYSINPSTNDGFINFSFNRTQRGFFIGFLNNRPCVTITSFLIYHSIIQCPFIPFTSNTLYSLPTTLAPDSTQEPLLIRPTCPELFEFSSNSTAACYANGSWGLPDTGDRCECRVDTYQTQSDTCNVCPDRSSSLGLRGVQNCSCEEGWFRGEGEAVSESCGQSPSAVRNLTIERSPVLNVEWNQPSYFGNRNLDSLFYRVCYRQSLSTGVGTCSDEVRETRYNLSGLTPSIEYVVAVTSLNPVSTASGVYNTTSLTFLSSFPNLTQPSYSGGYLNWSYALYAREQYRFQIRYQSVDTGNIVIVNVSLTSCVNVSVSVRNCSVLLPDLNVLRPITILILNPSGPGTNPISRTYNLVTLPVISLTLLDIIFYFVIPISTLFILCTIVFIILTICVCVLRKKCSSNSQKYQREMDSATMLENQLYQDPSQYVDLNKAVRALAKEIDPSDIEKETLIGVGEFGDVCKGYLNRNNRTVPVALKFLKPSPTPKVKDDFFKEASIMGQFCHPNVIFLYGVTLKKPIMIVTPYMENGSLDKYLVGNVFNLALGDQISMCCGVSRGMVYLSRKGYIHRDIAARNILVDKDLTPKITDFGLSRFSEENFYKVQSGGKIPVRWTAPEAILYRKFNSASDVWSFGVLMWEVMSFGQLPYGDTDNVMLLDQIQKGFRLQQPDRCPSLVYNLMTKCWDEAPDNRPSFQQLEQALVQTLEINKVRPTSFHMKLSHQNPLNCATLESWLASLKLERYTYNFTSNGYTNISHVWHLSEEELFAIGIVPVGHRNKIMNSIHKANNQLCFTYSLPV